MTIRDVFIHTASRLKFDTMPFPIKVLEASANTRQDSPCVAPLVLVSLDTI